MATAKLTKAGNWHAQPYIGKDKDGKWIRGSVTASTKKECERLAALAYTNGVIEEKAPRKLIEAANDYVADRRGVLAPSTITTYERIIKNDLVPLHDAFIDRLDSERVQAFISDFALYHSPKTTACVYGLLSSIITNERPDVRLHVRLPKRHPKEVQIPTREEVQRMIDESSGDLRAAIVLASSLGLRRAEICALIWADVRGNHLRVCRNLSQSPDGTWVTKAPKTVSGTRTITIPPAALPYLTKPKDADPKSQIVPMSPDALTRRYERLISRLQLHYKFHALRHYHASVLLSLQVPDKYAMARMGHSTPNMLKSVYQHLMADKRQEIEDQIDAYFASSEN